MLKLNRVNKKLKIEADIDEEKLEQVLNKIQEEKEIYRNEQIINLDVEEEDNAD